MIQFTVKNFGTVHAFVYDMMAKANIAYLNEFGRLKDVFGVDRLQKIVADDKRVLFLFKKRNILLWTPQNGIIAPKFCLCCGDPLPFTDKGDFCGAPECSRLKQGFFEFEEEEECEDRTKTSQG